MVSQSPAAKRPRESQRVDELDVWRGVVDPWKRLQRNAEKNLLDAGISIAELRILRVLRTEGSSPMHRFCSATMLSQPTITGVIDKLEERGLVERVRSSEDRREVLIAITSKGGHALAKGEDIHRRFVEKSLSVLHDDEAKTLVGLLGKLADATES